MNPTCRAEVQVANVAKQHMFTIEVYPHCDGVAIPLEDARILWQR